MKTDVANGKRRKSGGAIVYLLLCAAVALCANPLLSIAKEYPNHPNRFTFQEQGEEIGTLYRMGLENNPDHIPYFCEKLKSEDEEVRMAAIGQLLFIHDERAVAPLIAAMKDPSTKIRRGAIACLRRIGSPKAIPALKEALTFTPPKEEFKPQSLGRGREGLAMRVSALYKKHNTYEQKAGEDLPIEEYWNRIAAAYTLHTLGDNSGRATIVKYIMDENSRVGAMALETAMFMNLEEVVPLLIQKLQEDAINTEYLRAIWTIDHNCSIPDELLDKVIEFDEEAKSMDNLVARTQTFAFFSRFGDNRVIPVFRDYLEANNLNVGGTADIQFQYIIAQGLRHLKNPDYAAFVVNYLISPDMSEEGLVRNIADTRAFEVACQGLVEAPNESQIDALKKAYAHYAAPVDYFMNRLYVAWVIAEWGDQFGVDRLVEALNHKDAAVRRIAFKLLAKMNDAKTHNALYEAVKRETNDRNFNAMKKYLALAGLLNDKIKALPAPKHTPPVDTYGKPRYVYFNFDDCATVYAMERFADCVEDLADHDARWTFRACVAPLAIYDSEYNVYLLQRLFNRGIEIENHTLHHNKTPAASHLIASDDQTLRAEIGGCTNWLKAHINGLDKVYHWHPGGGGYIKPGQKLRTLSEIRQISKEAGLTEDIDYEVIEGAKLVQYVDPYAPDYHEALNPETLRDSDTPPLFPYRNQSDIGLGYAADEAWERIDAFAASFEHWYYNAPEKVMFFMGHDWTNGLASHRIGHEKHWDILGGFIKEAFVNMRDRCPLAYCVTNLEMAHIFNEGANPDDLLDQTTQLQTRAE